MSYALGKKIRLTSPWRTYSVGTELEQGFEADLESLVKAGLAEEVETPERPGKLTRNAAAKIAAGAKQLFNP